MASKADSSSAVLEDAELPLTAALLSCAFETAMVGWNSRAVAAARRLLTDPCKLPGACCGVGEAARDDFTDSFADELAARLSLPIDPTADVETARDDPLPLCGLKCELY